MAAPMGIRELAGKAGFPPELRPVRQLGRGAYGTVFLCEDKVSGAQVAVKHVRHAAGHGKSMLREIRLLARLHHENLLHLLDFAAVPSPTFEDIYLVLPYMPADLHKVIQSRQGLTEKHVQVIFVQILRALEHLHATGVAHRDLKPANILLTSDCKLKVCDFGLARGDMFAAAEPLGTRGDKAPGSPRSAGACGADDVLTEYVVTRWYRAPEVMLLPKQYTSAVDIWSAGCVLGEVLGRRPLFPGKNHIDMICRVAKVIGTPAEEELLWLPRDSDAHTFMCNVCPKCEGLALDTLYPRASAPCLDLLGALLQWDPSSRPTAADALGHAYLCSYRRETTTPPAEEACGGVRASGERPPEPFDWSFDVFVPTSCAVKERLYIECARFHPEILERDSVIAPEVTDPAVPALSVRQSAKATSSATTPAPSVPAGRASRWGKRVQREGAAAASSSPPPERGHPEEICPPPLPPRRCASGGALATNAPFPPAAVAGG